ncbi:DNA N-6-adenine-methyltransferase [Hyalangium versicolor]|uniref:DNA N-6-adenine-methyltransferase n=1 Tax=Hyalangium versicolor TaxID=2861190 RepID=UPI001CCCAB59|nr:DNA N-6-adenine-methyltransferase [Hyalangium versicolor]
MGTAARVLPPKGNTAEWYTRRTDFNPLNEEFGFTVDVCAATREAAKVPRFFCPPGVDPSLVGAVATDGLAQSWRGERVWCNPGPYDARSLSLWAKKCASEADNGAELVVLAVPAWTDRGWWQDYVEPALQTGHAEMRRPRGRWRFGWPGCPDGLPGHGGKFPQALVIWRRQAREPPAGGGDAEHLLQSERAARLRAERARIRAEGELAGWLKGVELFRAQAAALEATADALRQQSELNRSGKRRTKVYFARGPTGNIKIGVSANPWARVASLQTGAGGGKIVLLAIVDGGVEDERRLHERFASTRLVGEWFSPTPEILELIASFPPAEDSRHAQTVGATEPPSVTPSVTQEEREKRKRELARTRQRNCRARKGSVTPSVTQGEEKKERLSTSPLPLPPPSVSEKRGSLALVTAAPRDGVRDTRREHHTSASLPAEVQALRSAWNELVAPHGFPAWGERTSKRLLGDAQDALDRRPLEEWQKAFALVPRAPVCRGELGSRQRASLVWLLVGQTREGYEPAECLLTGRWSLDPEPGQETAGVRPPVAHGRPGNRAERLGAEARATVEREQEELCASESQMEALARDDSPAGRLWHVALEEVQRDGRTYALQWLTRMRALAIVDEGLLLLECPDRFFRDWVDDHYRELLERHLSSRGLAGVRYVLPEDAGGTP